MSLTKDQARVMKHTAGPWIEDADGDIVAETSPDNLGDIICIAPAGFDASMERWPHNRSLITTAPEMLAALIDVFDNLLIDFPDDDPRKIRLQMLVDKATK